MEWEPLVRWAVDRLAAPLVVGGLGILLTYWLRRRIELRDAHLSELRGEVLQPMVGYLEEYVLPILRHEVGNIDVCFRLVPNPAGMLERPMVEHFLCVRPVKEPLQAYTFGMSAVVAMPGPPAGRLMDDARRHHFPHLLRKWEAIMARFQEYNEACLRYVETVRTEVVKENGLLREFNLQSDDPQWVNAIALGVIVFLRQIGLPVRELDFKANGERRVWSYNTLAVARGTVGQLLPLQANVGGMIARRDGVQQLIGKAKTLEVEVEALRTLTEDQLLKRRLPGKCPYV